MNPAIIALAEQLESYLFGFYTSLTGGNTGTVGTPNVRNTITSARELMNTNIIPLQDRHLIISAASEQSLLTDSTLQTYFAFARSQGVRESDLGRIDGFDIRMSQLSLTQTGTSYTLILGTQASGTFTLTFQCRVRHSSGSNN